MDAAARRAIAAKGPEAEILVDLKLMDRFNRLFGHVDPFVHSFVFVVWERGCVFRHGALGVHFCGRPYHVEHARGKAEKQQRDKSPRPRGKEIVNEETEPRTD